MSASREAIAETTLPPPTITKKRSEAVVELELPGAAKADPAEARRRLRHGAWHYMKSSCEGCPNQLRQIRYYDECEVLREFTIDYGRIQPVLSTIEVPAVPASGREVRSSHPQGDPLKRGPSPDASRGRLRQAYVPQRRTGQIFFTADWLQPLLMQGRRPGLPCFAADDALPTVDAVAPVRSCPCPQLPLSTQPCFLWKALSGAGAKSPIAGKGYAVND